MKYNLNKKLPLWFITVGTYLLLSISLSIADVELVTTGKDATVSEIREFFIDQNKVVVTFVGYSGSEYEDKMDMLKKAESILDEFDLSKHL